MRASDQALLDAIAPGRRNVWDRVLAADAVYVDENGTVYSRGDYLKALTPLPPNVSGSIAIADYQVRFDGDTALVIHKDDERENYHGIALRAAYLMTEAWLCRNGEWKLSLVHVYVEPKDPPAVPLSNAVLDSVAGRYSAAPDLVATVKRSGTALIFARPGRPDQTLLAETANVLFIPGQPREKWIVVRDATGAVTSLISRREGEDIVWKRMGG